MDLSEPKLISPMLDDFAMGDPISDHHGVRCCPAMKRDSDNKYIVKIISIPASQVQLNALLLTGAYKSEGAALAYFKELAEGICQEAEILKKLSALEGFISYEDWQIVPMENEVGYDVYLLGGYRRTLERFMRKNTITHLAAVNLGIDLCAAAAVSRRAGYLYVDMKPDNIFLTDKLEYRIGDLGFIHLDSLKYASLPDKYRSKYTAPEITDAFSSLNETLDTYAIGLILYQIFNGGALPEVTEEALPAPAYADYEMAEIILKACAFKPEDRWQDPVEMGQAIVEYMQRNGANDVPIVPIATPVVEPAEVSSEETKIALSIPETQEAEENGEQAPEAEDNGDQTPKAEEDNELKIINELIADDAEDISLEEEVPYEDLPEELSGILNQADELMTMQAPEPVVAPEPVEVTLDEEAEPEADEDEEQNAPAEEDDTASEAEEDSDGDYYDEDEEYDDEISIKKPSLKGLLTTIIIILLIGAIAVGGYYFYREYYIQNIDAFKVEGTDNQLVVQLTTDIEDELLTVVCVDTFGNKTTSSVNNGQAVFTDLKPNTIYKLEAQIDGFHKLVGNTSSSYTTPTQTNILQFGAVTGSADGSIVVSFTVEGQRAETWTITYSAADEQAQSVSFTGQMVTINNLTVGKEYTFTLSGESSVAIKGMTEMVYTPQPLVYAENLRIVSCENGALSVDWELAEGLSAESWEVRCYNDAGFEDTLTVTDTQATFTGLDTSLSYTVDVVASGMSVGRQVYMSQNSLTVTDVQASVNAFGQLEVSWEYDGTISDDGWLLLYAIDGSEHQELAECDGNSAVISPAVPGAHYDLVLQASDGVSVFGGTHSVDIPEAEKFDSYDFALSADQITPNMCLTPEEEDWSSYDLTDDDYTTTFTVGQKASFCMKSSHYDYSSAYVDLLVSFVIRDADDKIVSATSQMRTWYADLWYNGESCVDLPSLPGAAGDYNVTVYYNGAYVCDQDFTVEYAE